MQFFQDAAILKRASASRPSGELCDGDYDVLANGIVVGRIYQDAGAALVLVDHRSDQGVRRDDARGAPSTTNSFKSFGSTPRPCCLAIRSAFLERVNGKK